MKPLFVAGLALALACLMLPESAMALRLVHGQVILDKLDDYKNCQNEDYTGDFCQDALKRWVEAHPSDAFKAGKMTRKIMNSWAAVPFFAQAFDQNVGDCKDEDVKLSVVSALDLPADRDDNVIPQARKIGFDLCFNDMKNALVDALDDSRYAFKNLCHDLAAKGAISGMKLEKCQALK